MSARKGADVTGHDGRRRPKLAGGSAENERVAKAQRRSRGRGSGSGAGRPSAT